MLSTETNPEKIKRAKEAKITGWIKKPFDISEFRSQVQRTLA
jgi:AmiR/NasT family two-component response regulator